MTKFLSVTIKNHLDSNTEKNVVEFDELNKYLTEGWSIVSQETINSNVGVNFTIVYQIYKK